MASLATEIVKRELRSGKSVIQIARKYRVTRQAVYRHLNNLKKGSSKPEKRQKKNYNFIIDWKVYNEGLVKRGEFLLDFGLFGDWEEELEALNGAKRGRPYEYPASFILFFIRLKSLFKIDYRTLEGISRRLVVFIPQAQKAPDYTTFQVRSMGLGLELEVYGEAKEYDIAGDASGLKPTNRGEYRISPYGVKRKKFVKLHLAVNTKTKQVVYCNVTVEEVRDGKELPVMVSSARRCGKIENGYFDAAYDSIKNYGMLKAEGINPGIRPRRSMSLAWVRKRIKEIEQNGVGGGELVRLKVLEEYLSDEDGWRQRSGYGQRWAVENRFSVLKRAFSEYVCGKTLENIKREMIIKVNLMNLFTHLFTKLCTVSPRVHEIKKGQTELRHLR
jgi:hypothetical protein